MTLRAFHNDAAIKQRYLDRVAAHRAADELVKGIGWREGKGCAIGCTLEVYSHARYETELGIPEMLARLEDAIFEGLLDDAAQAWPERFLQAAPVGADLSRVGWQFLLWLLRDSKIGAFDHPAVAGVVQQCAKVLEAPARGEAIDMEAAEAACAAYAAYSAPDAARAARAVDSAANAAYAARSAADAARAARAAYRAAEAACAAYAIDSAAYAANAAEAAEAAEAAKSAADSAAESAAYAAESAAYAADSAAESAAYAANSEAYVRMADKLIELMETA